MTIREFNAKLNGFWWLQVYEARNRAELIAAIGNFSGNRRKGVASLKPEKIVPIPDPPNNIYFRQLLKLPY